jgi:putative transposase
VEHADIAVHQARLSWGPKQDSRDERTPRWEKTVKRKRHSETEIAAKLHRADRMAADGMLQSDIAQALGISVMTYHRWRASRSALEKKNSLERQEFEAPSLLIDRDKTAQLEKLQIENQRLRRLVTDLLLEKAKLEEML